MGSIGRLLSILPRNMTVPVIVLAAGWYGGAKYGAPDFLINSIDGAVKEGVDMVGGFIGGGEESADTAGE